MFWGGIVCFVCVPGSHEVIHSSNTNFLVGNLEKIRHYIWVTFSRLKSYTSLTSIKAPP